MIERQLLKYTLLEEVGHGGMAVVYRGIDTVLNREVAIKILHSHLAEEEESKQRFQREAHAVAKLKHDNIIEIYDYSGIDSPESFIVTEFIHGQTLKDYLARHPISHPEIAGMIIVEVCTALSHAHSLGVIHRDIKPENIMIRQDGRVKLTDFGIAQVIDVQRLTVTGQLLGSPAYMAPELVEGNPIDFRSDVFSVGTLLYQLATSELPFKGKNPHEVLKRIADGRYVTPEVANPVVGSNLAKIIHKALAHNPDDRYLDVIKLQDDLMVFLSEVGINNVTRELEEYFTSPVEYSQVLQDRVVKSLTARGKKALKRHRTPRALEYFNRVLCVDPANREILDMLGQITRRRRVSRVVALITLCAAMFCGAYFLSSYWPKLLSPAAQDRPLAGSFDAAAEGQQPGPESPPTTISDVGPPVAVKKDLPTKSRVVRAQPVMRRLEIIPTPKAVTIWVNGKRIGEYGPDLRHLRLPLGSPSQLTFRNDECCFEKVIVVGPRIIPRMLRVKLPWKPARVVVTVTPNVEADVLIDKLVTRPGHAAEVPIRPGSDNGKDKVVLKVSANGFSTVTRLVEVRANSTITVPVTLKRFK